MSASVTVQGSDHRSVSLTFDTSANFALAQQIAAALNAGIAAGKVVTAFDSDGPFPVLPTSVSGAVVQTQAGLVTLPTGYTTDLVTKPGSAVVFGNGAAGQTILSDVLTNLTFIDTGGSGTVVAGGGNNRLIISAGAAPAGAPSVGGGAAGGGPTHDNVDAKANAGHGARNDNDDDREGHDGRGDDGNDHGGNHHGGDDDGDDDHGGINNGPGGTPGGGAQNWSLFTGNGNDLIFVTGAVNATVGAGGGQNGIQLGSGQNLVISTGDDSIAGGSGATTIDATGAHSDFVQAESPATCCSSADLAAPQSSAAPAATPISARPAARSACRWSRAERRATTCCSPATARRR